MTVFFLSVAPIGEASRAAEVLLGPYTADEHGRRGVVVREARLNRAYNASVQLPERVDPDDGKKKRVRAAEVEGVGPIAAPPLRSVRPRDDAGGSGNLDPFEERPSGKLPKGVTIRLPRSCATSEDSSGGDYSRTEGTDAVDVGRTVSQVKQAVGRINLTGLATSECSSKASPSNAGDANIEGSGDALAIPRVTGGKLFLCSILLSGLAYDVASLARYGRKRWRTC